MTMTRKQKRLAVIGGLGAVLVLAETLILFALRDQIVFFESPTEIETKAVAAGTPARLGGLPIILGAKQARQNLHQRMDPWSPGKPNRVLKNTD